MLTFGLFLNAGAQLGASHSDVFALTLEQAELAEELGYHDVWVAEHHFIPFGINSNALTLAGFLLGRTRHLRVGTAVTLAPQYHPLQLAEQVAILDQCSGGRLDFGIGRGGYLREFEAFGINTERWSDEIEASAAVLLDAWTTEQVESENRWFKFAPVQVHPRCSTVSGPPMFLATTTPSTIEFAARSGLPLLHYWATPMDQRRKVETLYADAAACAGHLSGPSHVHALIALVTDNEKAVRERLRDNLVASFRAGDWPHVPQAKDRHLDSDGNPIDRDTLAGYVAAHAIVGPPSLVARRVLDLHEAIGASRLVLFMEPIVEREMLLSSVKRFALEVAPILRNEVSS